MRYLPAGGNAAVHHVRLGRLLAQLLVALAGPLAANMPVHEAPGRHDVQLLADVLADVLHRSPALGVLDGVLRLVEMLDSLQVFGQCLAAPSWPRSWGRTSNV